MAKYWMTVCEPVWQPIRLLFCFVFCWFSWMCMTSPLVFPPQRLYWNMKTMSWTLGSSTALLTRTGYPTSWMCLHGRCPLWARKVSVQTWGMWFLGAVRLRWLVVFDRPCGGEVRMTLLMTCLWWLTVSSQWEEYRKTQTWNVILTSFYLCQCIQGHLLQNHLRLAVSFKSLHGCKPFIFWLN